MVNRPTLLAPLKLLKLRIVVVAGGLVISYESAVAQLSDTLREAISLKKDALSFFHRSLNAEKKIFLSPTQWNDRDWMTLAILLSGGGMIMGNDREIFHQIQDWRSGTGDRVARYFAEPIGSGLLSLPLLAVMYAGGRIGDNPRIAQAAMAGASAFVVTVFNVQIMKSLMGRERPTKTDNPYVFHGPTLRNDALPSGHTAVAFAMATAIATCYDDNPWLNAGLWATAALTGWSRINDGKHWPSDVFAGAVLGYYMGRWVGRQWKMDRAGKTLSSISLQPMLAPQGTGFRLAWNLR
ncbi:MAG: phosphatase PAP2 family protein [Bacteroidales bacterium]